MIRPCKPSKFPRVFGDHCRADLLEGRVAVLKNCGNGDSATSSGGCWWHAISTRFDVKSKDLPPTLLHLPSIIASERSDKAGDI